jgi:hypothetical protein
LETTFVFGNIGSMGQRLLSGWSVEDAYAWAVGQDSALVLPLPGDDTEYAVRFTVHPLIYPGIRDVQGLKVSCGRHELGQFAITARCSFDVPLPIALTCGQEAVLLTLTHPDWIKPKEARAVDDDRMLSICFHSAALVRQGEHTAGSGHASSPQVHAIVAGAVTARQIAQIIGALPAFASNTAVHYIDLDVSVEQFIARVSEEAVDTARFCWIQADVGSARTRDELRARLPANCEIRVFPTPHMNALWPFQGGDSRAAPEPGRYSPSRYPFSDWIAASLSGLHMSDDMLFLMYESMSEKDMPELTALLAVDIARMEKAETNCDVKIAAFVQRNFRHKRLFLAPIVPGRALVREIVDRLLDTPTMRELTANAQLPDQLDSLMEGYIGRREEVPIHPLVARRLELAWWAPNLQYRWFNNRRGYKEYIVDYIRWLQWRP